MKITILDAATIGKDLDLSIFGEFGEVEIFDATSQDEAKERLVDTDVAILNKVKLNKENLENAKKLKLICITATGFDNVDLEYAKAKNIAVCNVKGYSTDSVAQLTVSLALSLVCHLSEYDEYCKSGQYTQSKIPNCLSPIFYELSGKTWGLYGYGNIGKKVGNIAQALGCKILVTKNTPQDDIECVSLEELFKRSDIISLHTPLNDGTYQAVNEEILSKAKNGAILVNVARGAIVDEEAVTRAIEDKKISGFATDVYTVEPIKEDSPFNRLKNCRNVIFTPHMAWGAYETRVRLMEEVYKNIKAFNAGEKRNRIV